VVMPVQGEHDEGLLSKIALGVVVVGAMGAVYLTVKKFRENKSNGSSGNKSGGSRQSTTDKASKPPTVPTDNRTPVKPLLPPPTASSTPATLRPTVPTPSDTPSSRPVETPANQVLRDTARQPVTPATPAVPAPNTPLRDPQAPRPEGETTRPEGAPEPGAGMLRDAPTTKHSVTGAASATTETRPPLGGANTFNSSFDSSRESPVFGGRPYTQLSDLDPRLAEFNPATSHPAFFGFKFDGPPS